MPAPTCTIIAGPNGAGKITLALTYLRDQNICTQFINADLIAAGLSPLAPEREAMKAGRLFLEAIHEQVNARESFAFETTLSGKSYVRFIRSYNPLSGPST